MDILKTVFLVAAGGAIGSTLRYMTTLVVNRYFSGSFPVATFIANIAGCILIGLFIGLLSKNGVQNDNLKLFLVTGFCGGYTTFSAFGYENFSLMQHNNLSVAIGLSVIFGLLAVGFGLFLGSR
ncbi:MAG TPA: fluoride efflux transporter CrcB [Flavobacterium sp.]|jgi:CrcB protein